MAKDYVAFFVYLINSLCFRYSVALHVICDVDKRIIEMHVGCTGSCADS
jgi:hypothetical protein